MTPPTPRFDSGDRYRRAIRGAGRRGRALLTRSSAAPQAPQAPAPVVGRAEAAPRFVRGGLVDRAFCEALTGRTFESDLEAARYVLEEGGGGWLPHPLIAADGLPKWVQDKLAQGNAHGVIRYLRRAEQGFRISPLIDTALLPGTPEERIAHPGGSLGMFLETADESTPLPGRPSVTLGEARAALTARAAELHAERELVGPRTTTEWDHEAEARWRARWADVPLPASDGPLVSVIMPVRDRAGIVEHALDSLAAQTLTAWELLVVDDGSTDATLEVLRARAAADPRITVLTQDHAGVCAARNRGLGAARGRYVAFLDSDNAWRPDFLQLAVTAMDGGGLRAAYAGMVLRSAHEPDRPVYRAFRGTHEHLMLLNHVDLNVFVVDRELAVEAGGFDESLRRWVDHDFALRVSALQELELLPFLAVDYDDTRDAEAPIDRITTRESEAWQYVVLGQHWVDWDAVRAAVPDRVPGRLSVVIPTWNDASMTLRAVDALLRNTPDVDLEIVVLDNGSRSEFALRLAAADLGIDQLRVVRLPRNLNFSIGCNVGFAHSTGEHVLFLNNDTEPQPGWWPPLVRHLEDPEVLGVQPLLLYPNGTIQSAGTVFPVAGSYPCHFLVMHPAEDAAKIRDLRFPVVTAAAVLMRASDVADLRAFDPIFVNGCEDIDLCLRANELRPGHFLLEPTSKVTHHEGMTEGRSTQIMENRRHLMDRWRGRLPGADLHRWNETGFEVAHIAGEWTERPRPIPFVVRPPAAPLADGTPALRWGIRIAAWGGERGDHWGDVHFGGSLATSLQALGQDAVVWRHHAHMLPTSRFDDVVLGIRGLDVVRPIPGKINVLWVISHPDDVPPEELRDFDLVFAASESWAATMTERSGRPVLPLLQATEFVPGDQPPGDGARPLFVGNGTADRPRPIVDDSLTAGVPIEVHGPGWDGRLPDGHWRSSYVANDRLGALYREHGLVLADHWGDMLAEGFLANRLFDAVASGARVISDDIAGTEVFEGAVQVYRSPEELALLCSPEGRDRFPDDAALADIAQRVAREHSFDARARQLLEAVRTLVTTDRA